MSQVVPCCERDIDGDGNCDRHPNGRTFRLRPLHDGVVVELEPIKEFTRGDIIKVAPEPIRIGRVKAVGKGRHYPGLDGAKEKFIPTELKVGERVAFFKAVTETRQGRALDLRLPDDHELIRETDALFVIPEGLDLEITR